MSKGLHHLVTAFAVLWTASAAAQPVPKSGPPAPASDTLRNTIQPSMRTG